ncbi:ECF-type sigma factor [Dokdonella sp.]|uniref:ECF-type sigma factor n=1 Tax=Dokdonella sp. TaxID=2291710 RepID=UPI003BAFD773
MAQVAELHVFAGLDLAEIGALLEQSERTTRRDWHKARGLLALALETLGHAGEP